LRAVGTLELWWEQTDVSLCADKLTMGGKNVGVFNVKLVQRGKLPVRVSGLVWVLEVGDLPEDRDLLNKGL
jgi:hypothetical protein